MASWELFSKTADIPLGVSRYSVYGGWLVSYCTMTGITSVFVADPLHEWAINPLVVDPPVVVPPVVVPPVVVPPVVVPPPAAAQPGHAKTLGMNLASVVDFAVQVPFNDMFKMSRDWISHTTVDWSKPPNPLPPWDDLRPIQQDVNGYVSSLLPGQEAGALFAYEDGPDAHLPGTYVVTWDGTGTVTLSGVTVLTTAPGKMTFKYDPVANQNPELRITALPDPANYIKNIRILKDDDKGALWDSRFIALLGNVNTFRFMDWGNTNDSTLSNWADRPTATSKSQSGARGGVCLEYMIALCNATNTNGYFNVPHLATDDYVKQMGTMLKMFMAPNLKIYVEFSNECWNGQFKQAGWCRDQGLAARISKDAWTAQAGFYSRRAKQIMDILKGVFGTDQRLVRVMAGQADNLGVTPQILGFESAASSCDAFAIADYFGYLIGSDTAAGVTAFLAKTTDQQMDVIAAASTAETVVIVQQIAALAPYKLPLIAYEGGPHLVGIGANQDNDALTTALIACAATPRMGDILAAHFAAWKNAGGGLFCYFSSIGAASKFGNWGMLKSMADTKNVKYIAVQKVINAELA